jgi:WD40 repeat protein
VNIPRWASFVSSHGTLRSGSSRATVQHDLPIDALPFVANLQGVVAIAQHPTEPFVFSAALDGVLRQWDIRTGVGASFHHLAFSFCFCSLAQCAPSGACQKVAFRVTIAPIPIPARPFCTAGQCVQSWTGHAAGIQALVPGPNGQMVLTGSDDGTARIFSVTG